MMAAARHFIYRGGDGRDVIPQDATHVSIDESITVIPAHLFWCHKNIVELICHAGVKRIEEFAFTKCARLRRLIIPGVEVVERYAFNICEVVTDIECPKLERIEDCAFRGCKSLSSINLPSAKVVEGWAFARCLAITEVKFGKSLESIGGSAFSNCPALERITIPLKNGSFPNDNTLKGCGNLVGIDLVEGAVLHDTIEALHFEEWKNDVNVAIDSINHGLPNASAGDYYDVGEKAVAIRDWTERVLRKIIDYKARHRLLLSEAMSVLQLTALPNDIVMNNVSSFLELPSYTFEGED